MTYSERLYIMESKQKAKDREEQERLKEIAKIERKKEQEKEQKQYEKDLKIACYHDFKASVERVFERVNPKDDLSIQVLLAQFYKLQNRNDYIKAIAKTVEEQDYLEKNYDKILNEVTKKWENHLKYVQFEQLKEEAEKQKEINNSTAFKIFMGVVLTGVIFWLLIKFALVIGIALAIIIFLVILGCAMK